MSQFPTSNQVVPNSCKINLQSNEAKQKNNIKKEFSLWKTTVQAVTMSTSQRIQNRSQSVFK